MGIDFKKMTIEVNSKWVTINFWDTAGQEQYKAINKSFYKNALGGIMVCDISSSDSLLGLDKWIEDFKKSADESAPFIIIGETVSEKNNRQPTRPTWRKVARSPSQICRSVLPNTEPTTFTKLASSPNSRS